MARFDATNSECFIYVYREGLLSSVGHDLKLRVADFTIVADEQEPSLQADFCADSLRVVGVVKGGKIIEDEPSPHDKREIEKNIREGVLEASKYPDIAFRSTAIEKTGNGYRITGWLNLHGVKKELQFMIRRQSSRAVAEVVIHQPDFHITPYRAFFGALRVKPDVRVEVSALLAIN
jgi:hypothetical protein